MSVMPRHSKKLSSENVHTQQSSLMEAQSAQNQPFKTIANCNFLLQCCLLHNHTGKSRMLPLWSTGFQFH